MSNDAKIGALFVEIGADLRKYFDATSKARAHTEQAGRSFAASFGAAGAKSAGALVDALRAVGGQVSVTFSNAGTQAAVAFGKPFESVPSSVARKVSAPQVQGTWGKAGGDASRAFSDAFRSVGRMILKRILLFGGAAALAAVFAMHGSKTAQVFSKAFGAAARGIVSPLGKVMFSAGVVAIFTLAGARAGFAFTRALATSVAGAGSSVVRAVARIGRMASNAMSSGVRGAMSAVMNPYALLGGTAAVGGIAVGLYKAITGAADLNESINKVQVAFGDSSKVAIDAADEMARKYGIVRKTFIDAAAGFGLIGQAAKLDDKASAELGVKMTRLAADLSSLQNLPFELALEKIRAGLVGEAEPLRTVGVLLSENAVKAEAFRLGLAKSKGELSETVKVQARASIIMTSLAKSTGDLERTQDSLKNKLREIGGRFQNLSAQVAQYFIPAAEAAGKVVGDLFKTLEGKVGAGGGAGIFQAIGDALKSAAEYAGMVVRNLGQFKDLMFKSSAEAPFGNAFQAIVEVLEKVFTTAVDNFMNFADYFAKKIAYAFEVASNNFSLAIQEAINKIPGFGAVNFGLTEKRYDEAKIARPEVKTADLANLPAIKRIREEAGAIAAVDKVRQVIPKAMGVVEKFFAAMRDLTAMEVVDKEKDLEFRRHVAKQRMELTDNAAAIGNVDRDRKLGKPRPAAGPDDRGTGVFAGAAAGAGRAMAAVDAAVEAAAGNRIKPIGPNGEGTGVFAGAEGGADRRHAVAEGFVGKKIRPIGADGEGTGVFAGAKGKPGSGQKRDDAALKLNSIEAKLNEAAAGKGPEATEAKKKLEDLQAFRKRGKQGPLANVPDKAAGQSFGLEDFHNEIQRGIFGGAGDPAEKTATATEKMAEILELLKGNGLAIKGNMVAVAT